MNNSQSGLSALVRASRSKRPAKWSEAYHAAKAGMDYAPLVGETIERKVVEFHTPLSESGADVLIRASRKVDVGNEVDDRITALNPSWTTLKADIASAAASGTVTRGFQSAFQRDYDAWTQFVAAHSGDWIVTHTTLDQIENYRQTLERWRTSFTSLGGVSTGTPTTGPAPGLIERAGSALGGATGIQEASRTASTVATSIAVVAVAAVAALIVIEGSSVAKRVT